MNITQYFKSLSKVEMVVFAFFVIYLIFDIYPPEFMAPFIDSPIGMVSTLMVTLFIFINYNPILGVISLFVAYEMIRRAGKINNRVPMAMYTPTQAKKDRELAEMNPIPDKSLEEMMVEQMAPIGQSSIISYTMSEYKPVASETHGASLI